MCRKNERTASVCVSFSSYLEKLELGGGLGVHGDTLNARREGHSRGGTWGGRKATDGDQSDRFEFMFEVTEQ